MNERERVGARWLRFRPLRVVLATAPILLATIATQVLLQTQRWSDAVAAMLVRPLLAVSCLALYAGYVRLVERRPPRELGGGPGAAGELGGGLALGVALLTLTISISWALGAYQIAPGAGWTAAGVALADSLSTSIIEELLFRAIFFRIIAERLGSWWALALSALLFGALHADNPAATVLSSAAIALEAGVLLAAAYVLMGRLWLPIGLHAGWNFAEGGIFGAVVSGSASPGLFRTMSKGAELLDGGAFGPEASLPAVLVCASAGVAMLWLAARRGRLVTRAEARVVGAR